MQSVVFSYHTCLPCHLLATKTAYVCIYRTDVGYLPIALGTALLDLFRSPVVVVSRTGWRGPQPESPIDDTCPRWGFWAVVDRKTPNV